MKPFLILLLPVLLLAACAEPGASLEIGDPFDTTMVDEPTSEDAEIVIAAGTFRSVAGVMDQLSCACSSGGYVTSPDGKETAICLDNFEEDVFCESITVAGTMVTKNVESSPENPCRGGAYAFVMVKSFECE